MAIHPDRVPRHIEERMEIFKYVYNLRADITDGETGFSQEDPADGWTKYYNKDGMRSPDYETNQDLIVAGCSHTNGVGVPDASRWGEMVGKSLGLSTGIVGISGGSIAGILNSVSAVIRKYGPPKTLMMFLPPISRYYVYADGLQYKMDPEYRYKDFAGKMVDSNLENYSQLPGAFSEYIKFPTYPSLVLSPHTIYEKNLRSIVQIIDLCKVAGTNLIWTCWNPDDFHNFSDELPGYFQFPDMGELGDLVDSGVCHQELRDAYPSHFDLGTDGNPGLPHNGAHWNMHVAEIFENMYKESLAL